MKLLFWFVGTAAALVASTGSALGQSTINWFTLDAAGGVQSSANVNLNFTAGQPDAGPVVTTSARYTITGGFWALENMGPASGRPSLIIELSGANVVLSWPSPSTGFVLQQTDSLDLLPISWANAGGSVSDDGVTRRVTIPHNVAHRFYRLRQP